MAQPTQPLPAWYTASVTTLTDAAGAPIATSTTLLFLPLTYYGPPIPLDPAAWTYGGLSSPASSATSSSSSIPSSSASATSSSAASSSASATPSSSSSMSASSATTSASSSAPMPTSTAEGGSLSNRNRNIAIITGTIAGAVLLLFLCLFCLYCRARRRRTAATTAGATSSRSFFPQRIPTPLSEDYYVVDREAGEGSPRHSGEEQDPFLRAHSQPQMRQTVAAPVASGVRDSTVSSNLRTLNSTSSGTNSGYGTEIERTLATFPFAVTHTRSHDNGYNPESNNGAQRRGKILSPEALQNISAESMANPEHQPTRPSPRRIPPPPASPPPEDNYFSSQDIQQTTPLLPPPRIVDPGRGNGGLMESSSGSNDEEVTLLTARRVRVGSRADPQVLPSSLAVSHSAQPSESAEAGPSSWLGLGRFSWFKNLESSSSLHRTHSEQATTPDSARRPVSGYMQQERPVSGAFVEGADAESRPVSGAFVFSVVTPEEPRSRPGVNLGDRPTSSASANSKASGGTVYHDARSEQWNSGSGKSSSGYGSGNGRGSAQPSGKVTPSEGEWGLLTPPPAVAGGEASGSGAGRHSPSHLRPQSRSQSPTEQSTGVDVLDTPVPSALTSFRPHPMMSAPLLSVSRSPYFPPGLAPHRMFASVDSGLDVLEEEPPARAADVWKSNAQSKRMTFGFGLGLGMPSLPASPSLTSVRSTDLRPSPSGSAATPNIRTLSPTHLPASRRMHNGENSGSLSSQSAVSVSLRHSGSISSDGRRRRRGQYSSNSDSRGSEGAPMSPALSAFGSRNATPAPRYMETLDESASSATPLLALQSMSASEPESSTAVSSRDGAAPTTAGTGTDSTGATVALEDFPDVPWALGLGKDWNAT